MRNITADLSNRIANVGFICACLVVSIHLTHPTHGVSRIIDCILAGGISRVAVPVFFAISGFLLAGKTSDAGWYGREVKKRFFSLLVPFFVWQSLIFFSAVPLSLAVDFRQGIPWGSTFCLGKSPWPSAVAWAGIDLTSMPIVVPLWFLRCLFLFVLASPLILCLTRRFGMYAICGLYCLFVIWRWYEDSCPMYLNVFLWYGFSLSGLTAFSFGMWLRENDIRILGVATSCSITLGMILAKILFPSLDRWLSPLILPVGAMALWQSVPSRTWPSWIVKNSFPIYLMHMIFVNHLVSFPRTIPSTASVFGFFLQWLVPIFASIVAACFLRRTNSRVAKFLFGGRG